MNKCVTALKLLSVDAINKANSGHPGICLGAAPMLFSLYNKNIRTNPDNPNWINRDRFIMAAGHGSALLYSMLHLSGFDISIDDMKNFRQWGSKTPGHPEYRHTAGIDATSGPLGQGIAMGVGMAIAETFLAARYNKEKYNVFDHYTYVLCGDGDLQEGVTQEAMSLAGHLELEKLIVLYDSNEIQLDGDVTLSQSEKVMEKYQAMGWHYDLVEDGSDVESIEQAIKRAKKTSSPTIIQIATKIGADSELEGDSASHGAPLGTDMTKALREKLGVTAKEFEVDPEVYDILKNNVKLRGQLEEQKWNKMLKEYKNLFSEDFQELEKVINDQLLEDISVLENYSEGTNLATRTSGGEVLDKLSKLLPNLIGGSADLTKSTKAKGADGHYSSTNRLGRNINFGVREHAMGAIVNGMTLHGGVKSFTGAFFVFSDYMKPSMRMASLMGIPSIYVFTHDSIAVGEDGPTHQPIEQLTGLRTIPNMNVIRPADANETLAAWRIALESKTTPTSIILTRQNLPTLSGTSYDNVMKGAYLISRSKKDSTGYLLGIGSEVSLCIEAQKILEKENIYVDVVSMPSTYLFEKQDDDYKLSLLPKNTKNSLAVEMGATLGWYKYANNVFGVDTFGASAPANIVFEKFGFTPDNIAKVYKKLYK